MKLHTKLALATAAAALGLAPAALGAMASAGPEYAPEHAPKGHAYGFYCKGQSKKHVKGEKGTAFSRCVQAMKAADRNDDLTARKACKTLSKKHLKGQQGTPFGNCVRGVNEMRREKAGS